VLRETNSSAVKLASAAHVIAVDPDPGKRDRALSLGADEAAAPDELDRQCDAVFDFVGSNESLAVAFATVAAEGILVLVGGARGAHPFSVNALAREAHVTTSVWGSRSDLAAVLDLARRGELDWDVEPLPLDRVNEALDRLRRGDVAGRLALVP
jgi:propanol-preferring alcohol dehydrogenase